MDDYAYRIKPLDESTWPAFAALVEANNGVFGGCWCIGFHPEGGEKDMTAALHTYGPSTATPAIRASYVAKTRKELRAANAPKRPLWDTEVNYGIKGPGNAYPDKDIGGRKAATYVAQTYLDSIRLGIARTFWYSWSAKTDLLGITMATGYPGAIAFQAARDWMVGGVADCRDGHVRTCRLTRDGARSLVAWTSSGSPGRLTVPAYATTMCTALNTCSSVRPGSRALVGRMPVQFTAR